MDVHVNVGCGQSPTPDWKNYDNSISLLLAKVPMSLWFCERIGLLNYQQREFIRFAREGKIEFANAAKRIPLPPQSVEALYSSHMLEHLDQKEVLGFLAEARRVLKSDGIIRLSVPDLSSYVRRYLADGDADAFIASTRLSMQYPKDLAGKMRFLIVGPRHHLWMYDGKSLCRLLSTHGFMEPQVLPAGVTHIKDPRGLDLTEREDDSVYVEAFNR